MDGATVHDLLILLLLVFGAGIVSGRLAAWLRLPDVVLFIAAGMILGPWLHWIAVPGGSLLNQLILALGAAIILFDGGVHIRWQGIKAVGITLTLLSVVGVLVTTLVTGCVAKIVFGLDWTTALLIGAVISSTDPATIIPVFRQVHVRTRLRETVESESAFNDATGSILVFALLAVLTGGGSPDVGHISWDFVKTAVGGLALGVLVSGVLVWLTAHRVAGIFREFATLMMLVAAIGCYVLGETLHVSGLMATFTAGLVWGNSRHLGLSMAEKEPEMEHVADQTSFIMRIFIFVLLGSQVNFTLLAEYFWPSLAIVLTLVFIARPLAVFVSALPDVRSKWSWRELVFMCWVRETGVIPAALMGMIVAAGVAGADKLAAVVFMAIVFTILIQASTTAWLARRLGLEEKRAGS